MSDFTHVALNKPTSNIFRKYNTIIKKSEYVQNIPINKKIDVNKIHSIAKMLNIKLNINTTLKFSKKVIYKPTISNQFTILYIDTKKNIIAGYLHGEVMFGVFNIELVSVHPQYRGQKICNVLIKLLIQNTNFEKYNLIDVSPKTLSGNRIGDFCYDKIFKQHNFNVSNNNGFKTFIKKQII